MRKVLTFMAIIILINTSNVRLLAKNTDKVRIDSKHAICIDRKTLRVLYEKKGYEITAMASTTKIMTALLALESGDLYSKLKVSGKAASVRGSTIHLRQGDEILLKELIVGLMTKSGNDAAITIAEGMSGSVEEYCYRMNEKAMRMGLFNTNFITPHGLDEDYHYTTAYDLAVLSASAMQNQTFRTIVGSKNYSEQGFTRDYQNINKILWKLPEANGIKTGFTHDAGKCLVTSAKIGENEVIIVTINSPDRWNSAETIYNYVAENYKWESVDYEKGDILANIDGKKINLMPNEKLTIPIKNGSTMSTEVEYNESVKESDIQSLSKFGRINVFENEELIYQIPLNIE